MPIYILDFDHTLFNAQDFKKDLAKALGLSLPAWEKSYQKNKKKHKNYNYKEQLKEFDKTQQKKFLKVLDNSKKYLYKDSIQFIRQLGSRRTLLSKGHTGWQAVKIKKCGLNKYLEVKTTTKSKKNFIKKLSKKETIFFINDRGKEIDEIKKAFPDVIAIWVKRSNGQYKNEACKKYDYKTNNLKINIKTYGSIPC